MSYFQSFHFIQNYSILISNRFYFKQQTFISSVVAGQVGFFSKPIYLKIVCMRLRKSNLCPRVNLGFPFLLISFSPEPANQIPSSWPSKSSGWCSSSFILSYCFISLKVFFLFLPLCSSATSKFSSCLFLQENIIPAQLFGKKD